jgi:hypothetical protein
MCRYPYQNVCDTGAGAGAGAEAGAVVGTVEPPATLLNWLITDVFTDGNDAADDRGEP